MFQDISLPPHPSHGKNGLANIGKGGHGLSPSDRNILAFYAGNLDRYVHSLCLNCTSSFPFLFFKVVVFALLSKTNGPRILNSAFSWATSLTNVTSTIWKHQNFASFFEAMRWAPIPKKFIIHSSSCCLLQGWSPCLMDAVWFGCVPVIISDYYDLPLQGLVDWNQFAVFVRESKAR